MKNLEECIQELEAIESLYYRMDNEILDTHVIVAKHPLTFEVAKNSAKSSGVMYEVLGDNVIELTRSFEDCHMRAAMYIIDAIERLKEEHVK